MINFQDIHERTTPYIQDLLDELKIASKLVGKQLQYINPLRDDNDFGSASINVETGIFKDFADDTKGGDLVAFVAGIKNIPPAAAAEYLATFLNEKRNKDVREKIAKPCASKTSGQFVMPIPANTAAPHESQDYLDKAAACYVYHDADANRVCYIYRFENADGSKKFTPQTLHKGATGQTFWKAAGLPTPRPLYNLHLLARKPDAPVLIVEGEKSADAAAALFPDHVVVTTMNGAQSPEKTDLSPLVGRNVYIWPDHDDVGQQYAEKVTAILRSHDGRTHVHIMQPITFSATCNADKSPTLMPGFTPPKGWDAADALVEGWTAEHIKRLTDDAWKEVPAETGEYLADRTYYKDDTGVFSVKRTEDGEEYMRLICSPLTINALSRDQTNTNWGIVLEFKDADNFSHKWCMPKEMLASGNIYRQALLNMGLDIEASDGRNDQLAAYIQAIKPTQRALSVTKPGWHKKVFVFPDKVTGNGNETVVLNTNDPKNAAIFRQHGSFDEWKNEVALLCRGNSRLILSMCIGLSGPFLYHLGIENGGFHFQGESSTGKTTAGMIAASVWGDHSSFIKTWRTTGNALESVASRHNDTMLILDELAEVNAHEAGNIAYMLGNGQGKGRANRNGQAREVASWRLLFLSTGEISLADHIASAGGRVTAGQEVRVLNIPSDGGARMGIFENLHGTESPQLFATRIKEVTLDNYGFAGPAIIDLLVEQVGLETLLRAIRTSIDQFVAANVPGIASGQVHRVAKRFGLLAAVGELAVERGIVPWTAGEASQSVLTCFQAWLEARGGVHDSETEQAVAVVRQFFELHGESRFTQWSYDSTSPFEVRTINRAGFRKATDDGRNVFYVLAEAWKNEVCKGLNSRYVTRVLMEKGLILPANDGKPTQSIRLPGLGVNRVYVISPDILGLAQ